MVSCIHLHKLKHSHICFILYGFVVCCNISSLFGCLSVSPSGLVYVSYLDGYNLRIFIRIQCILNWSYKRNEWISVLYFLFIWLCVIMICDFVLNTNTCWIFLHYWITYCDEIEYTYHFKTHTSTRLRVCYLVCQIISHLDEINGEQNGDGMCVWLRCYFEGRNWKIFV